MKYFFLLLTPIYYIIRSMPTLLEHDELFKGLSLFLLTALSGIFFTGWYFSFRTETRVRKKLGDKTYEWLADE